MLAAMQVGIPFMPLSPAYALLGHDFSKLKQIFALTNPSLIYLSSPKPYAQALQALDLKQTPILASAEDGKGNITLLEDYKSVKPGASFEAAYQAVGPDSVSKFMFTSGSTGAPKAVIMTQRMMCANVAAHCQILASLEHTPPVIVDWLPWNHVAGGNVNFNKISDDADMAELIRNKELRAAFQAGLADHNSKNPGSSRKILRLAMLTEPPSLSTGEITEKGYLNQRAIFERRSGDVTRLFGPNENDNMIAA